MFDNIVPPNKNQKMLFKALDEEIIKRYPGLDDVSRHFVVARFVDSFDWENTAIQSKSVQAWADLIMSEISLKLNGNESNIRYWIYEFEMSDKTAEMMENVCSQLRLTLDEFFEEALKYAVRLAGEELEEFTKSCLEAEQSSDIDIKEIRHYPVFKGETEALALDRKLQEETAFKK